MTVRATLESHLGSRQVARVVYGAIIGLTLIVAVEDHPPSAAVMAAWLVLTGVTVALAEVYSEVIGVETSERHRVTRHQLAHLLGQGWAVLLGVAFPAVFFLLAVVGVLELHTAFASARWSGLGLIGFYGYWAARFAGAPVPRAVAQAAAVATIGALVIAFKVLLH
jgi:VIT1/CCC1 family predicted Fe2+/Mn2+ transporter